MKNSKLGLITPLRSHDALLALRLRLLGTAAALVLLMALPTGLAAQQQQPAPPQQQQQEKRTAAPPTYPGAPFARQALRPAADQAKKTASSGTPVAPEKPAAPGKTTDAGRAAPAPLSPAAHQSATAKKPAAKQKASAAPPQTKPVKTAAKGPNPEERGKPGPGVGSYRTCLSGDDSPEGTVTDGFRKVVVPTMMGLSCHWEKVQ
jgi:hypothetical protein